MYIKSHGKPFSVGFQFYEQAENTRDFSREMNRLCFLLISLLILSAIQAVF